MMKSFKDYITEKPHKIGTMNKYNSPQFSEIRGLLNPNMDELINFTKRTKYKSSRIIAGRGGKAKNLFVWDAEIATHPDVMKGENLDPKEYITGTISLQRVFGTFDDKEWIIELGKNENEAKKISKQYRGLKELIKKFPDTKFDGFYGI